MRDRIDGVVRVGKRLQMGGLGVRGVTRKNKEERLRKREIVKRVRGLLVGRGSTMMKNVIRFSFLGLLDEKEL